MLLSYLSPEERKAYKQGDCILYGKNVYDDQEGLKAEYETQQKEGNTQRYYLGGGSYFLPVLKVFCAYCGDPFYTKNSSRKYCSSRCVNDAYMARRKARKEAEREKVCRVCGKHFTGKSKATIYCSDACKQKAYRQRRYENQLGQI